MSEIQTKALDAYLRSQHRSLPSALSLLGQDPASLDGTTMPDSVTGRIARFLGITPEQLQLNCAKYETAAPIEMAPVAIAPIDA